MAGIMVDVSRLSRSMKALNRDLQKIGRELQQRAAKLDSVAARRLALAGNEMRNYIITSMRNTPRQSSFYRKGVNKSIKHQASVPGAFPAIDTGELIRSIMYDVGRFSLEIGSVGGGKYSKWLEEGTTRMKARPWLEPTAQKFSADILNALGRDFEKSIGGAFEK